MIDPTHYDSNLEPEEAARLAARPAPAPKNTLVLIGSVSDIRAYLNITREEAMARYTVEQQLDEPLDPSMVKEFEFTDSFNVYDAWSR